MPFSSLKKVPVNPASEPESQPIHFRAPTGGWVSAKNPAANSQVPFKLYGPPAERLENLFPNEIGVGVMGGSRQQAQLGTNIGDFPCESIWSYIGGTTRQLKAAGNGKIFDITTPVSNTAPPTADVTGRTANYYSAQNFATSGGFFQYLCNDGDKPLIYNGTTYTAVDGVSVPAITGVTTSTLTQVNGYKNRLFFVQGGTMNVWALPVGQIGGAAIQISLAGIFNKGGSVLFTATWSLDAGNGLNANLVIMSTEGEVAIYNGTDPSDATAWSLVGVYDAPKPLGKNGWCKAAADLLLVTEQGLIPVSTLKGRDKANIGSFAVSRAIEPDWITDARTRRALPWEAVIWSNRQRLIVSNPVTADTGATPPWAYVVNTTTGAWCKRTGWNTRCMTLHNDFVYFGTNDGTIMQMEIGASDGATGATAGANYYPVMVLGWSDMGQPGYQKTVLSMIARFTVTAPINPQLSASTDFAILLPSPPNAQPEITAPGQWDVGLWDVSKWDTGSTQVAYSTGWVSVNQSGFAHALQMQMTMGGTVTPSVTLLQVSALIEGGQVMLL